MCSSISRGLPVLARLGGAVPYPLPVVPENRLVAAVIGALRRDPVPHRGELPADLLAEAALEVHGAAVRHRFVRRLRGPRVADARRVAGLLEVHAEIDHVDE